MSDYIKKGTHLLGPFIFLCVYFFPTSLEQKQQLFLAIFAWVIHGWLLGSLPLYITGFIGVSLSAILKLESSQVLLASFGHPIIFLFLGGFLLAKALNNVGLDNRISLYLLTRDFIKGSVSRLLFTLMALTTVFTMWISNTATTAMMLPLVLGTLKSLKIKSKQVISLILISIAYASSIGGIATPIGSTPNIIGVGMLQEFVNIKITFFEWAVIGFPLAIIFLGILFLLVHFAIKNENIKFDNSFLKDEFNKLPPLNHFDYFTILIFSFTVFLWLLPSVAKLMGTKLPIELNPGIVAILGSSFLFIFPFAEKKKILNAQDLKTIDWSSLMLFGSGIALGKLLFSLGLAKLAGEYITSIIAHWPLFLTILIILTSVIFFTEVSSNTASANIIIPIIISLAQELNLSPLYFAMGVSVACGLAFMLPVATPPNAIVFGSEMVSKTDMMRKGFALNIIYAFILSTVIYLLV